MAALAALGGGIPLAAESAPTGVAFTSPAAGATLSGNYYQGTGCQVTGSGINRVVFYLDSAQLNTELTSPWQCNLDTRKFSNGTHTLRAVAYARDGTSTSVSRSVTIQNGTASSPANGAPSVSIKGPLNGATLSGVVAEPACEALASDPDGIEQVLFYVDNTLIRTEKVAPYTCDIDTRAFADGTHVLKAVATDKKGASSTAQVSLTFKNGTVTTPPPDTSPPPPTTSNPAPTVSIKGPLNGATLSGVVAEPACEALASDADGIEQVLFYVDNTLIRTEKVAPYTCDIDTRAFADGTHVLKAVATDKKGASSTAQVSLTFKNGTAPAPTPNQAPNVSFTSPSAGQTVSGTISFAASATDDKAVSRVVFTANGTTILTDTAAPFSGTLDTKTLPNGTTTLTATAYDAEGLSKSASVAVNVQNAVANTPPAVSIKSPLNGATLSGVVAEPACEALASDVDGIAQVLFYVDNTLIRTEKVAPYTCDIDTTKFADGTHTLKAVATDGKGASSTAQVSLTFKNGATTPPPGGNDGGSNPPTSSLPSTNTKAVATFESIGLYWKPGANPGTAGCSVRYKKVGDSAWKEGLAMWYDGRNAECRGSLVHLAPNTNYEVQMGYGGTFRAGLVSKTWSEQFPIAKTVTLSSGSSQVNITEGGTANGYVLYTGPAGTTLDGKNSATYNIRVAAPYVIIRGLTLKGAKVDAIRLDPGAHSVVIEKNDISDWGRSRSGSLGVDGDSGVRAICNSSWRTERIVIQNNKIHHPRYGSNSWSSGHPAGPQAVTLWECGGNQVIRYNEVYSSSGKYFNDGIGAGENYSTFGFPYADTDIYGNKISQTYDDGIEAEGGNRNVRIWGNYVDDTYIAVASTATHTGPLYVFRNVYNRGGTFGKSGQNSGYGGGRRYFFHNSTLQGGSGVTMGIKGNTGQPMTNSWSRNNNWHMKSAGNMAIGVISGSENSFDYDMSNGNMTPYSGAQKSGVVGAPTYVSGHGAASGAGGNYQLAPGSRGYDQGVRIPNFNDDFLGAGPDMGAHENGKPAMKFGVR